MKKVKAHRKFTLANGMEIVRSNPPESEQHKKKFMDSLISFLRTHPGVYYLVNKYKNRGSAHSMASALRRSKMVARVDKVPNGQNLNGVWAKFDGK